MNYKYKIVWKIGGVPFSLRTNAKSKVRDIANQSGIEQYSEYHFLNGIYVKIATYRKVGKIWKNISLLNIV